ncbi:unnamed protein product [Lampetra fluviatilis]
MEWGPLPLLLLLLLAVTSRARHYHHHQQQQHQQQHQHHLHRVRIGPHVCQTPMGPLCCPGWSLSPGSGLCLRPVCVYGCRNGYCVAPNLCLCHNGQQAFTCADGAGDAIQTNFISREFTNFSSPRLSEGHVASCLSHRCEQSCGLVNGAPLSGGISLLSVPDVDECVRGGGPPAAPPVCPQRCVNVLGGYRCRCHDGYRLAGNGRSCIATSPG